MGMKRLMKRQPGAKHPLAHQSIKAAIAHGAGGAATPWRQRGGSESIKRQAGIIANGGSQHHLASAWRRETIRRAYQRRWRINSAAAYGNEKIIKL
jgi:hypothetical protein